MQIAFLGFGLIAGSIARAMRTGPDGRARDESVRLVAWSPSGAGPAAARQGGILDATAASPLEAVRDADLAIIAAPPLAVLELLDRLAEGASQLPERLVLTDVASTKAHIVERASSLGLPFVGGHPMAGLEVSGYANARADLFVGRPWVVVADDATDRRERVSVVDGLARRVGANPVRMGAREHDEAVAAVSHLPLVLAAALVEAVAGREGAVRDDWPAAAGLAATGWRDMTRLARGDVEMAAGIAATNGPALAARVRDIRDVLDGWIRDLEADDPDGRSLAERFRGARDRLEGGTP